jgi:hypothetical protein
MKIDRLRYDVTIPIAAYGINDHIGAEAIVELTEDPTQAFMQLKSQVDAMARAAYPHLYANGMKINSNLDTGHFEAEAPPAFLRPAPPKEVQIEKPEPKTTKEKILQQINECADKRVVETFRILVQKDDELKAAYEKRIEELSPKINT